MIYLRVVSNETLYPITVGRLQQVVANNLGNGEEKDVFIETSGGLTATDTVILQIHAEKDVFNKPSFRRKCKIIANFLQENTKKSVLVMRPVDGGMDVLYFLTTHDPELHLVTG